MTTDTDRTYPVGLSHGRRYAAGLSLIIIPIVLGVAALGCVDNRRIGPREDAGVRIDAGSCTPACAGRVCGTDGCGGSCGTCPVGSACDAIGQCGSCTPSCAGRVCGDNGCGGSCGTCAVGSSCDAAGQCQSGCTPSCAGRECGTDGCSGTCGTCSGGETCSASGVCESGTCSDPADCGSPTAFICDPSTLLCTSPECASSSDCLSTEICLLQADGATQGACYTECVPASPSCGSGALCNQIDFSGRVGFCQRTGTSSEGAVCDASATSSGCAAGLICINEGSGTGVCRRTCQVFGSSTCPFGQNCHPVGACVATTAADAASVGGVCSGEPAAWCAVVSGRITGACDSSGICRELCRIGLSDCPSTQTCVDEFETSDIGLCTP